MNAPENAPESDASESDVPQSDVPEGNGPEGNGPEGNGPGDNVTAISHANRMKTQLLSEDWVTAVASTRDTDLRAHRVALTYHYFARELDSRINNRDSVWACLDNLRPPPRSNANWFNFGTWATVTINRDLSLRTTPAGHLPGRRALTPLILHLRAADGQRVSRALSWGQRLVFLSTTMMFVRHWAGADFKPDGMDRTFQDIQSLARWGDEEYLQTHRHLEVIWDAFNAYHRAAQAAREGDQALAAQRTLLGTLLITAVEQDVVNDAVRQTIEYLPRFLSGSLTDRVAMALDRWREVPRELTALNLPFEIGPATETATDLWARVMTEHILVMMLPSETLRLGRDVPPRDKAFPMFPAELSDFSLAEPDTQELAQLVAGFDRSSGDGRGSAARDWRRYDDRLNWAVNMIRSRQQDVSLYWAPYTQEDQQRIVDGKLPHRGGDPSDYEVQAPLGGLSPVRPTR